MNYTIHKLFNFVLSAHHMRSMYFSQVSSEIYKRVKIKLVSVYSASNVNRCRAYKNKMKTNLSPTSGYLGTFNCLIRPFAFVVLVPKINLAKSLIIKINCTVTIVITIYVLRSN